MPHTDVTLLIKAIYQSFIWGGVGITFLLVLFGILGRIWINRTMEQERAKLQEGLLKGIEHEKAALQEEIDRQRISSTLRADICMELWSELQEVKSIGARLWKTANEELLEDYIMQLIKTRKIAARAEILLSHDVNERLLEVLESFDDFLEGKILLVDIRNKADLKQELDTYEIQQDIHDVIQDNLVTKYHYESLLRDIANELRGVFRAQ